MSQKHGSVAEVLGNGTVGADGGESESRLLLKEIYGGFELFVNQMELRFVTLWVTLDLTLKDRKAELIGAPARRLQGLRRKT